MEFEECPERLKLAYCTGMAKGILGCAEIIITGPEKEAIVLSLKRLIHCMESLDGTK